MASSFRLEVVPGLFEPENRALAHAWSSARRLLVVRDSAMGGRGDLLLAYLAGEQARGAIDHYLVIEAKGDGSTALSACSEVVESAIQARLGRRDIFVSFASEQMSQVVAAAAVSFRRYTRSIRICADLSGTVAAVRDGGRAALLDDPVSAPQRDTTIIVDEHGLIAEGPSDQRERGALLALSVLQTRLIDQIENATAVERRVRALDAIVRLCRRLGPGNPVWRLAETWLTLVPDAIDPVRRREWSLLLAAQVANRLGVLPSVSFTRIRGIAHDLDPYLAENSPSAVRRDAVQSWVVEQEVLGDHRDVTVPLPTGDEDGARLIGVDRTELEAALLAGFDGSSQRDADRGPSPQFRPAQPGRSSYAMAIAAEVRTSISTSFSVKFTDQLLDARGTEFDDVLPRSSRILVVVDPYLPDQVRRVDHFFTTLREQGRVAQFAVITAPATDRVKTLDQVSRVMHVAERLGLGRRDRLVVIGGGTVMDIVGYAAYLYRGDTPYVRIPTTLVGMIDAGIGLKVGVNVGRHKNLLGAYHPPMACICDVGFLRTLPKQERRCGIAEAIKISVVCDEELFTLIERHFDDVVAGADTEAVRRILSRSVSTMLRQLEDNPFEDSTRRLPDFGHEFGHMLESMSDYRLRHGEAVAIGMAMSCCVGNYVGCLSRSTLTRVLRLIQQVGLKIYDPICDAAIIWRKLHDEVLPHKAGGLHLVVPSTVGAGDFIDSIGDISLEMIADACDELRTGGLGRFE